jgi:hypothetical protein
MAFQITIKEAHDDLKKGDLLYWRGKIMKVTSEGRHKDGSVTTKFRLVGRVRLKPEEKQ